jgi:hypothetical protein
VKREKTTRCFSVRVIIGLMLIGLPVAGQAMSETQLADSLRSTFNEQGWQEQRSEDGSVIYRQPNEQSKLAKKAAAAKEEPIKQQLAESLNERGWQVDWQSDGSLVLKPKAKSISTSARPSEPAATQSGSESVPDKLATGLSGSKYWRTERGKNGELLFYPLATAPVIKTAQADRFSMSRCEGYQLPGSRRMLPVDQWYKAKQLAQEWMAATRISGLLVGPIRRIHHSYMVALVEDRSPYRLKHMLAIRVSDGRVIDLN